MDTKFCMKCEQTKPVAQFNFRKGDARHQAGYRPDCRACRAAYMVAYRKTHVPSPAEKAQKALLHNAWHRKNYKAHVARYGARKRINWLVRTAVNRGDIQKHPCLICGEPKVQGHHVAYDLPLDVVWLCRAHHTELHTQCRNYQLT